MPVLGHDFPVGRHLESSINDGADWDTTSCAISLHQKSSTFRMVCQLHCVLNAHVFYTMFNLALPCETLNGTVGMK